MRKKTIAGRAGLVLLIAAGILSGCVNTNPVGPVPREEILYHWTFEGTKEGFIGEEYGYGCAVNETQDGLGTVELISLTNSPTEMYLWVEDGNRFWGGGWYYGGWYREFTSPVLEKRDKPFIFVRVRSTNDSVKFQPRRMTIQVLHNTESEWDKFFEQHSDAVISHDKHDELFFYPPAADFTGTLRLMINVNNNIAADGDSWGYFIDEIKIGYKTYTY